MKLSYFGFIILLLPVFMAAEPFDRVIATVNDEPIFVTEFEQYFRNLYTQEQISRMSQDQYNRSHDLIIRQLIDELLIMQYINKNLSASEKENIRQIVEQQTSQLLEKEQSKYSTPQQLKSVEQERGMSWEDLRANIRRNLRKKYIQENVLPRITRNMVEPPTAEEIQQFKEENPDFDPTGAIQIAHILLRIPENASQEEEQKTLALAREIADQARTGANFAQLAQQYSEHVESKNRGGQLPPFQKGEYLPEFDQLFELNRGAISEPIRTKLGYHVVKVLQKNTLEDQVFKMKWDKKTREWIDDLREEATIRMFLEDMAMQASSQ